MLSRTSHAANFTRAHIVPWMLCAMVTLSPCLAMKANAADSSSGASIMNAAEAAKVLPATVFFRGQSASVQARNSGGVKLPDGMLVLCALVDTSGYSTAVQQKYQAYFITEVTLEINGQTLKPGAYGVGFIEGTKFIVMDVGAHDSLYRGWKSRCGIETAHALAGSRRYHTRPLPALHQPELRCVCSRPRPVKGRGTTPSRDPFRSGCRLWRTSPITLSLRKPSCSPTASVSLSP